MRSSVTALLALALALAAQPGQAQWKWKDSRGQVHISDIPPPREVPDKDVLQRPDAAARRAAPPPAASAASAAASRPLVDSELEARRGRAEEEQKAKAKADEDKLAAQRSENCQRARTQLAGLDSGQRMARINDKGEREVLDDKGRAEEAQRARKAIAADCR